MEEWDSGSALRLFCYEVSAAFKVVLLDTGSGATLTASWLEELDGTTPEGFAGCASLRASRLIWHNREQREVGCCSAVCSRLLRSVVSANTEDAQCL